MNKIIRFISSLKFAGILLIILSIVLAAATFIENDFGSMQAKEVVYASWWFELILILLALNLLGSIKKYSLYKREKISRGIFHLAFVFVLAGGFFTKHFSQEGLMHIREGECSSSYFMDETEFSFSATGKKLNFSQHYITDNNAGFYKVGAVASADKNIKQQIDIFHYPEGNVPVIYESQSGRPVMAIMIATQNNTYNIGITTGQRFNFGDLQIGFESNSNEGIEITFENDSLFMICADTLYKRQMMGGGEESAQYNPGERILLSTFAIFESENMKFVITDFNPSGIIRFEKDPQQQSPPQILVVVQTSEKTLFLPISKSKTGSETHTMILPNLNIAASWSPKIVSLPFKVCLNNFVIERYPGSMSPSSYLSNVTLMDKNEGIRIDYEIYMNNILKHNGFRFYQSSYDQDELGTILSVRKDVWGTGLSYIGYFLMVLGMIWALVDKKSRFSGMLNTLKTTNVKSLILVLALFFTGITSLSAANQVPEVEKSTADKFAQLQVLGANGRIMPVNTLSDEILRTLYGSQHYHGMSSDQVILSMIADAGLWMDEPIIKVRFEELKKRLNLTGNHAAFSDLVDSNTGNYILAPDVEAAYNKKPVYRSKYDKEVMKVDERLNVLYLILTNKYLKLFPVPHDDMNSWITAGDDLSALSGNDSLFVYGINTMLAEAVYTNNQVQLLDYIEAIDIYQHKWGGSVIIEEEKVKAEIFSNKLDIFNRLWHFYSLFGFVMIIIYIIQVAKPFKRYRWISKVGFIHLFVAFIIHSLALALRWYISGHAPWSNGYESLVFMSWSAMLAGLIFYRRESFALWGTAVLSAMVLMVAHLSWMSPQITNLVPVLKSVWLTIHVSVITSSYGFLGLGAVIGLAAILLQIFSGVKHRDSVNDSIKRLTTMSEIILIPGLYLLTIGTFLGAIWANVSWGRYWGWDPKETWALITILIYAFVLHMKYIPGLKNRYLYNVMSVFAFSSILMTYFGVNYYLSGLHSYAGGDPVPIPGWLYMVIGVLIFIFVLGNNKYRLDKKHYEAIDQR